jgi:hypothetical protein
MSKEKLWLMACERGVIKGDTSFYNMTRYSKTDLCKLIFDDISNKDLTRRN